MKSPLPFPERAAAALFASGIFGAISNESPEGLLDRTAEIIRREFTDADVLAWLLEHKASVADIPAMSIRAAVGGFYHDGEFVVADELGEAHFGKTVAQAMAEMREHRNRTAAKRAQDKRDQAAKLLAEANALCPAT